MNIERTSLVALVVPAVMLAGIALCDVIAPAPHPLLGSRHDPMRVRVRQIAYRWYSSWAVQNDADCPADLSGLARVVGAGREDLEDVWGAPFRFACKPGGWFGVWSLGPDGLDGTGDEITSWKREVQRDACPQHLLRIARSINSEPDTIRVECEHDPALAVWFLSPRSPRPVI
jgi:hypothetical protein